MNDDSIYTPPPPDFLSLSGESGDYAGTPDEPSLTPLGNELLSRKPVADPPPAISRALASASSRIASPFNAALQEIGRRVLAQEAQERAIDALVDTNRNTEDRLRDAAEQVEYIQRARGDLSFVFAQAILAIAKALPSDSGRLGQADLENVRHEVEAWAQRALKYQETVHEIPS